MLTRKSPRVADFQYRNTPFGFADENQELRAEVTLGKVISRSVDPRRKQAVRFLHPAENNYPENVRPRVRYHPRPQTLPPSSQ